MSKIYDEYLKLKEKDKNKLYLFKCGNFYIFLAEDCELINEYVVLKKVPFSKEINKCGFPLNSLENYLRVFKNHKLDIEVINEIKEKDINEIIEQINVDSMTPLEALMKLKELKEIIKWKK